jgi:hypothetical protein
MHERPLPPDDPRVSKPTGTSKPAAEVGLADDVGIYIPMRQKRSAPEGATEPTGTDDPAAEDS